MDTELLVPYGINPAGLLVSAADADRTTAYRCPECQSALVLRAGEVVVHHFAHKADTACTGETISHETAKRLLAQVIREQTAIESPRTISLACACDRCASTFLVQLPRDRFTRAAVEHRVGNFVCDVAGLKNDEVILALEVLATHAVPEAKAHALSVPWIEVTAESVLTDPYRWTPTNSRLKPVVCPSCKTFLGKLMVLAERWDIPLDRLAGYRDPARATYLAAIEPCWKCGEEILVFWWPGVPFCEAEPPKPRPRTIQNLYSKTFGGKYWANTCPGCKALQGDNFIFLGHKGTPAFKGLPLRDSPELQRARVASESRLVDAMFRNRWP